MKHITLHKIIVTAVALCWGTSLGWASGVVASPCTTIIRVKLPNGSDELQTVNCSNNPSNNWPGSGDYLVLTGDNFSCGSFDGATSCGQPVINTLSE